MPKPGFIYVLLNPAMPDLLKIGKTSRLPETRARELSGTGVPTEFTVAYHKFFADCDAAEHAVHALLALDRVSDNREFFRTSLATVIDALVAAEKLIDSSHATAFRTTTGNEPWASLLIEADNAYYGFGGEIQDERRARFLYEQAANVGAPEAYLQLGNIYRYGSIGSKQSRETALDWLNKGARHGIPWCWASIADIYMNDAPIHRENGCKCLYQFFKYLDLSSLDDEQEREYYFRLKTYIALCRYYPSNGYGNDYMSVANNAATGLADRVSGMPDSEERVARLTAVQNLMRPNIAHGRTAPAFHVLGDHAQVSFVIDGQPISDQQSKNFSTQIPVNALQSMEPTTSNGFFHPSQRVRIFIAFATIAVFVYWFTPVKHTKTTVHSNHPVEPSLNQTIPMKPPIHLNQRAQARNDLRRQRQQALDDLKEERSRLCDFAALKGNVYKRYSTTVDIDALQHGL